MIETVCKNSKKVSWHFHYYCNTMVFWVPCIWYTNMVIIYQEIAKFYCIPKRYHSYSHRVILKGILKMTNTTILCFHKLVANLYEFVWSHLYIFGTICLCPRPHWRLGLRMDHHAYFFHPKKHTPICKNCFFVFVFFFRLGTCVCHPYH